MRKLFSTLAIFSLAGLAVTGCQTTGSVLSEDATAFTRGELYAYLSDKTEDWGDGNGAFYSAEGTVETMWDGAKDEGTWSTNKDGSMCWHIKSWGETPCTTYYHNGEVVSAVYDGETTLASELHEGNALEYLAAGVAVPEPEVAPEYEKILFTKEETTALVMDKTIIWEGNGGAYYAPDYTLITMWDGERVEGTWSVGDDGGVCWQVPGWGTTPCQYYFYNGEELWTEYKKEDSVAEPLVDGDTTGSM